MVATTPLGVSLENELLSCSSWSKSRLSQAIHSYPSLSRHIRNKDRVRKTLTSLVGKVSSLKFLSISFSLLSSRRYKNYPKVKRSKKEKGQNASDLMEGSHLLIDNRQASCPGPRLLGVVTHPFPDGSGEAPGQDASRMSCVLGKVSWSSDNWGRNLCSWVLEP